MTNYPDRWIIVKVTNKETGDVHHRVFANWYGGYLGSDSWQLNSGIDRVEIEDGNYMFHGRSGSLYVCGMDNYGTSGYGAGVLDSIIKRSELATIEPLENQDWLTLNG